MIILRVAPIYGPERDPIGAIESGTLTIYGDGRNFVSHIQVDDLIAILARVPAEGQPGAIYNVGDDAPMRQYELAAEVRRRLGMVPQRTFSSAAALHSGLDILRASPLIPDDIAISGAIYDVDTGKVREVVRA